MLLRVGWWPLSTTPLLRERRPHVVRSDLTPPGRHRQPAIRRSGHGGNPDGPDPTFRTNDDHRRRARDLARVPAGNRPARLRRVPAAGHRGGPRLRSLPTTSRTSPLVAGSALPWWSTRRRGGQTWTGAHASATTRSGSPPSTGAPSNTSEHSRPTVPVVRWSTSSTAWSARAATATSSVRPCRRRRRRRTTACKPEPSRKPARR